MKKTMRMLYALAAVVILGTLVYAQDKPQAGTGEEKKAIPNAANLVRSVNGLQGDLTLQAGTNISITPSGNALTIAAPNALTAVSHDVTLSGAGTPASPLRVVSQDTAVDRFFEQEFGGFAENTLGIVLITVPVGKQLIVQHVSISCELGPGDEPVLSIIGNGMGTFHELNLTRPGSINRWTTSQPMTLHLNPFEAVFIQVRKTTSVASGSCSASASGRFVPAP